jgi:hypothetical protein
MSLWNDLWSEALAAFDQASAGSWNRTRQALGTQLENALAAHGGGVVGETDFEAADGGGLSINIAAGRAVAETAKGFVAFRATATYQLTGLPASEAAVYIYVGAVIAADPTTDPDSRLDNSLEYSFDTTGGEVAGKVLIASCATNGSGIETDSIVDLRTFIRAQEALNALDALEALLDALQTAVDAIKVNQGEDYWDVNGDPVAGADTVSARLTALEASEGGVIYWGGLEKSSGDPTTIAEYITSMLSGGEDEEAGAAPTIQLPSDLEISNHLRLVMRLMHALPEVEETQQYSYYFVPGISDDSLYDAVNTTATVDSATRTIG